MSILTAPRLRRPREDWPGHSLAVEKPLRLDSGVDFGPFTIAYQTYGTLNPERSNAVLICHALTGDQYVADPHPITGNPGWWTTLVGPGGVLDTERYFLICANVLGGCMGTTGPKDINPATGEPWALVLPGDHDPRHGAGAEAADRPSRHRAAVLRDRRLDGRDAGVAMGLELPRARCSRRCRSPASARHSAQNIAFHEVGRQAIMADPDWCGGRYLSLGRSPSRGLAVARMAAHITYLSEAGAAPQIRPQPAGPQRRHLRVRRRFPGRELSAPPGQHLCRPVRRQLLSLHHPRDGLFRPRRRARRVIAGRLLAARSRASASSPSPATGCSRPRKAAPWCMR